MCDIQYTRIYTKVIEGLLKKLYGVIEVWRIFPYIVYSSEQMFEYFV